jgi:Flp pilus assembly protein TadD
VSRVARSKKRPRRPPPASAPPARAAAPARPSWTRPALWAGLIVVLTCVAYVPAMRGGFIWDDDAYVTNNTTLRDAAGLARIWLEPQSVPQYYPLVFTGFWAEYHLWGLAPLGYHVVNVLLHAASAVLLWRLLARLAVPGAWLAAAVFALHPVHVESVGWITERKNVLSGLFYLAAFHAYLRFDDAGRRRWGAYAACVALFVCALLSKTVTSSLPIAVAIALWWRRGRLEARDLVPLLPLLVVGAGFGALTAWLEQHHVGAGEDWSLTRPERFLIAGRAPWFYLGKLVWPHPLVFIYPRWALDPHAWWQVALSVATVAVAAVAWALRARVGRGPLAATLFFGATLFPALGFVDVYPFRYSFVADHFQYMASIGPIALLCGLAVRGAARLPRPAATIAAAALLAVLGALTWDQGYAYADLETLWRDTIAKNPDAGMAHDNLANILLARGALAEAVDHYREALRVKPNHVEARNNMGAALVRLGRVDEAIGHLREALRIQPIFSEPHFNLGVAYATQGKTADAIAEYSEAIRIRPTHADAQNNLGSLLVGQGKLQEATDHFRAAVQARPDFPEAHTNLGYVYLRTNALDDAAREYQTAIRLRQNYASPQNWLGVVYVRQGKPADAVAAFRAALRSRPDWSEAEKNLAWVLATGSDAAVRSGAEAVGLAERASRQTNQKDAAVLETLAAAYAEAGRFPEAADAADRALAIAGGNAALADDVRMRAAAYRRGEAVHDGLAPPPR